MRSAVGAVNQKGRVSSAFVANSLLLLLFVLEMNRFATLSAVERIDHVGQYGAVNHGFSVAIIGSVNDTYLLLTAA
jgi:hypothetical protein